MARFANSNATAREQMVDTKCPATAKASTAPALLAWDNLTFSPTSS